MSEHLRARSARYEILIPSENISSIGVWNEALRPLKGSLRLDRGGGPLVLDTRVMLGLSDPKREPPCVSIEWQSSDGERRATLIVDAVEQIVDCDEQTLLSLPRAPRDARRFFDRACYDSELGMFRLRLRPDLEVPLSSYAERRRFRSAVVTQATGA
ncbi:MAG: hypothetical protein JJE39_06910 [Vicinamibacteria bacterium]|nr:hypothetical protein [Vicinamibacteria bacterium]